MLFPKLPTRPENMTMFIPGEPPDAALEIGKAVARYIHINFGKELTYRIVDSQEFISTIQPPPNVRKLMEAHAWHMLAIEVIPDEDWDIEKSHEFMGMVGAKAFELAHEMFGHGDDDEGEEWKYGVPQDS